MKTFWRTLSFCLLGLLLAGCAANGIVRTDPDQVARAAAEIADLELPAGYGADFSARAMGYTVAAFHPGDGHSHLYLVQSAKAADGEALESMLSELDPGPRGAQARATAIETRRATVRGQETTLAISEGVNSDGDTYRQAMVTFQGKGGPALLVFSEPVSRWDPQRVDDLLASIR